MQQQFEARLAENRRDWSHCHAVVPTRPTMRPTHDGMLLDLGAGCEVELTATHLRSRQRRVALSTVAAVGLVFGQGQVCIEGLRGQRIEKLLCRTTSIRGWSTVTWLCAVLSTLLRDIEGAGPEAIPDRLRALLEGADD